MIYPIDAFLDEQEALTTILRDELEMTRISVRAVSFPRSPFIDPAPPAILFDA